MAYVGASPANRALTSADIAPGSVTLNDINFTDTPTNMNITGVINKHTMRLAEGVTVTGDVTISDNLILSKISDDGVGITLTNDSSTRTITGSGSIEASTLAQTPNASLTGMTGTVGSGVVFPSGHVIQTQYSQVETFGHMTGCQHTNPNYTVIKSSGAASTNLSDTGMIQVTIIPKSGSTVKLEAQWMGELDADLLQDVIFTIVRSVGGTHTAIKNNATANNSTTNGTRGIGVGFRTYHEAHVSSTPEGASLTYFDTAHGGNGSTAVIYKLAYKANTANLLNISTNRCHSTGFDAMEMGISSISATEIAG
jgi:hypothetical protein